MSLSKATAVSPGSDGRDLPDPENVFGQLIEDDATICQRCYRRHLVPVLVPVPVEATEKTGSTLTAIDEPDVGDTHVNTKTYVPTDDVADHCYPPRVVRATDNVNERDDIHVPKEWGASTPSPKRHCECGAIDEGGSPPPLPKGDALNNAERISTRLEECDVRHDPEVLVDVVRARKSNPETAGRDTETFATAVEAAVRALQIN